MAAGAFILFHYSSFVRVKGLIAPLSRHYAKVSPVASIEVLCIDGRNYAAGNSACTVKTVLRSLGLGNMDFLMSELYLEKILVNFFCILVVESRFTVFFSRFFWITLSKLTVG